MDKGVVLDSQKMVQLEVFKELDKDSIIITDHYDGDGNDDNNGASQRSNEEKVLIVAPELVRISLMDDKACRVVHPD